MFKRIAGAALVMGAALTVIPVSAFAQDRDDYRFRGPYERNYYGEYSAPYRAPYGNGYAAREYRERVREERKEQRWREHEWREHERHERRAYDRAYRNSARYEDWHR